MIDSRFFQNTGPYNLKDITSFVGLETTESTSNVIINDISTIEEAKKGEIVFLGNLKYRHLLEQCNASACILEGSNRKFLPETIVPIISSTPLYSFALVMKKFYPANSNKFFDNEKKDSVATYRNSNKDIYISNSATIMDGVKIGNFSSINANCFIGSNVEIGSNVVVEPNVVITHSIIGDNVTIKSGSVIGPTGFGYLRDGDKSFHIPQLGRVVIENDVEIGANCAIARGSLKDTYIGSGTKIDNLVHIAHNVVIGKNCDIAACVGFAGSVKVGNKVSIGGMVGISGHLTIVNGAQIAAKSGVTKNVKDNTKVMGYPARPMIDYLKEVSKSTKR